ncbi:MAG: DUF3820 family protein [Chlamydiia bacterium]|nr:DUF3820 family protein [Chlamydiia bacterium]
MKPIYYDTETTGIKADKERIVEIAAYDPVDDRSFVKLVNPGIPIPAEAAAVHHISDEMVADASPFSDVGQEFIEFCQGEVVLIAHNNDGFDLPFLKAEFARNQLEMPSWPFIDSLKWARRYRPDLPKHSLQFLREIYGFAANNAHRALDDVIILHKVFSIMIDDLPLQTVFDLLNVKKEVTTMPFGKHQGKPIADIPKDYVTWLKDNGALDKPDNTELKEAFTACGLI